MKSTIICTLGFLILAANVAYSLPAISDFNITLNEVEADPTNPEYQVKTVVLDAGHGGKDPGCLGKKTSEKEVALDVVLKVGQMIKNSYPDVKVIYTRDSDEFIPLHERSAIANRNQADLFISVHCNGTDKKSVSGSETFVLGLHRVAHNLEVAKRENASILKEENYQQNYDGFDPNSDESHIALSMYQSAYLDQSIALATLIEGEFVDHAGRTSRGVKQAGFMVLKNATMPSVLVEAGFLTNAKEENFLITEDGKMRTATSIFNAFSKYKYDIESYAQQQPKTQTAQVSEATQTTVEVTEPTMDVAVAEKPHVEDKMPQVAETKPQVEKPTQSSAAVKTEMQKTESTVASSTRVTKPAAAPKYQATTSEATNRYRSQQAQRTTVASGSRPTTTSSSRPTTQVVSSDEKVEYVVQVAAGAHKLKPTGAKWQKLEDVLIRYENGMYKYQVGGLYNFQAANQKKTYLKQIGFNDCFIAAYKDGKPVKLTEVAMAGGH